MLAIDAKSLEISYLVRVMYCKLLVSDFHSLLGLCEAWGGAA